jgi:ABC-2 type transport system permease protein
MNNLLKMDCYQLFHSRLYWYGTLGVFLIGFLTADTYVPEVMGPSGGMAESLADIVDGMVYDSTFLLILISCILAVCLGQEFSWRTISQEVCTGHGRRHIFTSKLMVYLSAFNAMALIYPIAGCIREIARFGLAQIQELLYHLVKAAAYSLLLNSAVFLIPILCCFYFRNTAKAVASAALITFVSSLYLGYGMMLGFPVDFLPTFQIRKAVTDASLISLGSILTAVLWLLPLCLITWRIFCRSELT